MLNVKEIIELWESEETYYRALGNTVVEAIREKTLNYEIKPEITFRTKELLSLIKKIKKKEKGYDEITDKLGVRIICSFNNEIKLVKNVIKSLFIITKIDDKLNIDNFDKLTYRSIHYDVKIKSKLFAPKIQDLNKVFEIQVRTLNQHAWANSAHVLSYKAEVEIPSTLNRRIYRLLSLYELADDEFDVINTEIGKNPENFIFKIFRLIEGKFFKYARVDYDKEMTITALKKVIPLLEEFYNKRLIEKNIRSFIEANENKIIQIFEENRSAMYEKPLLFQPEVFLSWYCLAKHEYTFIELWEENFDVSDLEYIKDCWGFNTIG